MQVAWKSNWEQSKKHFESWWRREGFVLGFWGAGSRSVPHEDVADPGREPPTGNRYTNPEWRARSEHYGLAHSEFPADILPLPFLDTGPGSLALMLGSEPGFSPETVWFEPCMDPESPESYPPLRFDPDNRWWRITEQTMKASRRLAEGKYVVGAPDLIENIDILAALREPQHLLMDMVERPEWVERKVAEINQVWFDVFSRIYDIIKLDDGSSAFNAFRLWGPGKVAKVQCDASAMFSPDMFERFVVPALTEQCEWLDHSMFHLDGHQCIQHLDLLLAIDALDAVEWTPDPQVPPGGSAKWYPLYQRILDAGKSVQAVGVQPQEVEPLLDAVGAPGMYIHVNTNERAEIEKLYALAERYL